MDAPFDAPDALIRPWRTATLVASLVAAVELVLLVVAASSCSRSRSRTRCSARRRPPRSTAPKKQIAAETQATQLPPSPKLTRDETKVFVLNGNGRSGAAAAAAAKLQTFGYRVPGTGNAARTDYATTVVMYRAATRRSADASPTTCTCKVVGPLDGLKPAALHGGQLAVLLGAR